MEKVAFFTRVPFVLYVTSMNAFGSKEFRGGKEGGKYRGTRARVRAQFRSTVVELKKKMKENSVLFMASFFNTYVEIPLVSLLNFYIFGVNLISFV